MEMFGSALSYGFIQRPLECGLLLLAQLFVLFNTSLLAPSAAKNNKWEPNILFAPKSQSHKQESYILFLRCCFYDGTSKTVGTYQIRSCYLQPLQKCKADAILFFFLTQAVFLQMCFYGSSWETQAVFCSVYGSIMGLNKLWEHTRLEVASFSHCRAIWGTPNFGFLPAQAVFFQIYFYG